jgi:hypothetical protein
VTSARRAGANRNNARASTGPKSAAGKRRSAMNARRHGLSIPVVSDPVWSSDVRVLAREIAGNDASREQQELARQVAAAQIDVIRVRQARFDLIKQKLADENFQSQKKVRLFALIAKDLAKFPRESTPRVLAELTRKLTGPDKFATVISDFIGQLMQFDRYERRALSRRKFAIRNFEKAR